MRAVLLVLMLTVLLLPQAGAAPVNAVVRIWLSPPEIDVNAGFHDQYIVFNGTVSVDDTLDRELTVILQPLMSYPLGVACSPDYVVFRGSGSAPFNCTVKIPAKTNNLTSAVYVNAQAHYRTDIVGANQSPPVTVVVGALTAPAPHEDSFGIAYVSRNAGMLPVIVFLAVVVAAVSVWAAARRRRQKRAETAGMVTEGTSGPP